jgi:hypothetical protein
VRRYRSLEWLRGFGVMLMVFMHGALYHYGSLQDIDLAHPPLIVTLIGFLLMWGGLFAVLSGASHAIRAVERLDQRTPAATLLRWEWHSGAGYIVLGVAYFVFVGPTLIDLAAGTRDHSVVVGLVRSGSVQAPSVARVVYMNTLFMVGFSTLLAAPLFAWMARRSDPRSARFQIGIAAAAALALGTSWLRIPLYPLFEQALTEGRHGFVLATFWLVGKNDPIWPSLGLLLCGTLLGLVMVSPPQRGRLRLPVGLGLLLLAAGIAGWVFGPSSMLRRSIDSTWFSIMLVQAGVILLGVTGFHWRLDATGVAARSAGPLARMFTRFSRASLSVLFGETVLAECAGRVLDGVLPGWNLSLTAAVLFGVASAALWTLVLARWERSNYRGSLEQGWVRAMAALGRPSTRLAASGG